MGKLSNRDVDDLVEAEYEEALIEEEPWALDAHAHRAAVLSPTTTPEKRNPFALEDDCDADD